MTSSTMNTFAHVISALHAGVSSAFKNFMEALHYTRRQRAANELERWRHLMSRDDDSLCMFKPNSTAKNRK